ncbi:MAG: tetratricopeptide repeat protein [Alphaproteobacteria bacterium]|nr:tetratricopeptide repeat protein [Alphaproteobacteria bacterium]
MQDKVEQSGRGVRRRLAALALTGAMAAGIGLVAGPGGAVKADGTAREYQLVSRDLTRLGSEALQAGDADTARHVLESAVAADPSNAAAFSLMARAYQTTGDEPRARKFYGTALVIDPQETSALGWSGELDLAGNDLTSAQAKLDRLARICGECESYRRLKDMMDDRPGAAAQAADLDRMRGLEGSGG